jgi:glutaminyl-tRNA synthetase
VETDSDGHVIALHCSADLDTLGKKPEGRKVKGVIHWVSASEGKPVSIRLYDRLFTAENPESKQIEDYRDCLNPDSLIEITGGLIEPSAAAGAQQQFQFEREGYFCLDQQDSSPDKLVFNRTITLRDSWAK